MIKQDTTWEQVGLKRIQKSKVSVEFEPTS